MPGKGKRSQAQKLRWQRSNEIHCATTTEEAECSGPQSSGEVKMSAASHAGSVEQGGHPDASCVPQVSYADIVKRGRHSDTTCEAGPSNVNQENSRGQSDGSCVPQVSYADIVMRGQQSDESCEAGPSNVKQVNHRGQSYAPCAPQAFAAELSHADFVNLGDEQHVRASRSQASVKYGRTRNQQCTCNSQTLLAFLHENENITRADLNLVLEKGNMMYKETRKRVVDHIYLTTDELPDEVPARRLTHYVDMTQLSRYGTLGEPLPGSVDSFLNLESGLSCLLSDVKYALLLMRLLCIAVFRTRSGRYGFFDPHSRTARGLPPSRTPGTAVMVTFTRLSDMIDRLKKSYRMMRTQSSCNYELKPVEFYNVNTVNLNDALPNTDCRPTAVTEEEPTLLDEAVDESYSPTLKTNTATDRPENILPEMSPHTTAVKQPEVLITSFQSHDAPHNTPSTDDWCKGILEVLPLEKLTHTLHDNVKGFLKIWKPVLDIVDPSGLDFALPD
ncbi:uncharacterized protein LOC116397914 [Anarrhichthys ocellatus]|uniref:uncharacterized protein LOC116397914 n=1 Tax=Anarrhichthys ocellatus TaxID=433405 RepID=UPI0012EEA50A|nr:uncharacterized protein LOC116397914 [Anarrhichthys ocellatus]